MAYAISDPYYLSKVRNLKNQKELTTGSSFLSPEEMTAMVTGELEARYAGEDRNRQFALKERNQALVEKQYESGLSQWELTYSQQQEALKKQGQAAMLQGYGQLATGGVGLYGLGKSIGAWGDTTPLASQTAAAGAGYSAFGAGMAPATGYSLYGTAGGTTGGLSVPAGTLSTGVTAGGTTGGLSVPAGTLSTGTTASPGLAPAGYGVAGSAAAGYVGGQIGRWKPIQKTTPWGGEKTERRAGGFAAGAGAGAYAGSAYGPYGTAVGAVVGGVIGAVTGGSVICTELNRQGYLPDEILQYDSQYGKSLDREVYLGYRIIADPIVCLMQKSKAFTQIVRPFCTAFAYEASSRVNKNIKGNLLGKFIIKVGIPLCKFVNSLGNREVCYVIS